jgi:hypothetical protein
MWRVSGYRDRAISSGGERAFLQCFGIELSHWQSFGNKLLGQNFTRSDGDRIFPLTDKVQQLTTTPVPSRFAASRSAPIPLVATGSFEKATY